MKKLTYAGAGLAALAILILTPSGASAQGRIWFDVEIAAPGETPVLIPGMTDVTVDDIVFDYEKVTDITLDLPATLTKDRQQGYVLYRTRPGKNKPLRVTMKREFATDQTLRNWRQEVVDGETERKSISIVLQNDAGTEVSRWTFDECEPVQWEVSPDGQAETLTCSIGSITLAGREFTDTKVSEVVVTKINRNGVVSAPIFWDSWSGGEPALLNKWIFQGTKYHEDVPGNLSVEPLTLTGDVRGAHQAIYEWINSALNGQPWVLSVTLRERLFPRPPKRDLTFVFYDCFPIRYVFPRLSVTNTTGNTVEEVHFKPIRLELK